jgi:hypothetical protein
MATEITRRLICDGCGKEIDPALTESVAPLALRDERGIDVHFHDHRCLIPFANKRHTERTAFLRKHYETTRDELIALKDSADPTHKPEDKTRWKAQLVEAENRLAMFEKSVK